MLICGASGTGKSQVSYPLARRLGVPLVEMDDIVEALQAMTTPEQLPLLHLWRTHPEASAWSPERVTEAQIQITRALAPAVDALVANHLETDTPVVIEGDYLLPRTAPGVRAVVLHEQDEEQLVANYASREPELGAQHSRARASKLYGDWLAEQAHAAGVPVIQARPWSDVVDRVATMVANSCPVGG